uniref:PDZ domain-containing protein n=1 Tax=Emiliania huxleyi TaxID=2903 RepID=A0A7S3RFE6_EMIHU
MLALSVAVCSFVAPAGTASRGSVAAATAAAPVAPHVRMMNLFGRTEESKKQREFLSLRDAPSGSTRVQFRKPNQATTGLTLGLKFRESFGKAVYIDQILPNTEASRLEKSGKIQKGDEARALALSVLPCPLPPPAGALQGCSERPLCPRPQIVMVSATFGGEMWSAKGIGKMRLEKSIAVRQGMTIDFVVERSGEKDKKAKQKASEAAKKEADKMSRLQAQLTREVKEDKQEFSQNPFKFW